MQGRALIRLTMERIDAEDAAGIDALLAQVPFDNIEGKIIDNMLESFLLRAIGGNKMLSIQAIIASWKERVTGDVGSMSGPTLPLRLLTSRLDDDIVVSSMRAFAGSNLLPPDIYAEETTAEFENLTILQAIESVILFSVNEPDSLIGARRAFQAFGNQPEDTLRALLEIIGDRNGYVANFVAEKVKEVSQYAPVPSWVRNFLPEIPVEEDLFLSLPDYRVKDYPIWSDKEIVDAVLEGLEESGASIEDLETTRDWFTEAIQSSSLLEKAEILRPIIQARSDANLEEDITMVRIVGPANPLIEPTPEESEYGGPRMLTDNTYDYNKETGAKKEWFVGNCQICLRKIRYYWHAIRMPESRGGWEGCYCSEECLVQGYELQGEFDPIQRRLITLFHEQLEKVGIQERLPNPEVEEEGGEEPEEM